MNEKETDRLWGRASFTIEASYLMPVILFLLVFVGTAALYLHDRCVACFDAQAITVYGRMLALGNSGEEESLLASYVSEEGSQGMLMTTEVQADGKIGTRKISADVEGGIGNAFAALFFAWGWPSFGSFSASEEDWNTDPCSLIRSARILTGSFGED